MEVLPVLLLSLAATSDSFVIGFNYGVKGVRINQVSNLFISLICFVGTYAAMLGGKLLGAFVSDTVATLLGGGLLLALGLYMLLSALLPGKQKKSRTDPELLDRDNSKIIELRESSLIGLVLCINNLGLGIGAGIAGLPVVATSTICAGASFLFVRGGSLLGKRMQEAGCSRLMELLSSLLVMGLGILEIVPL